MLIKRIKQNSVQEYEYKGKEIRFDDYIQVRIEKQKKEKLKEIAQAKGYSTYSKLVKVLIDDLISDYDKNN